ncbi:Uncharacterised protein [Mycobacteroides abscessus subsp. abscessus]|nr:Uncharacterised protein [Mycobacteroides abscessus subsp. abscessus]
MTACTGLSEASATITIAPPSWRARISAPIAIHRRTAFSSTRRSNLSSWAHVSRTTAAP